MGVTETIVFAVVVDLVFVARALYIAWRYVKQGSTKRQAMTIMLPSMVIAQLILVSIVVMKYLTSSVYGR